MHLFIGGHAERLHILLTNTVNWAQRVIKYYFNQIDIYLFEIVGLLVG